MGRSVNTPSTQWALRQLGSVSLGIPTGSKALKLLFKLKNFLTPGPSVQASAFQLKNCITGDVETITFTGVGVSAGLPSASASLQPDWITFETEKAYTFSDFEGFANVGGLSAGLGVNYSLSYVMFNGIDVKQAEYKRERIDLSGFSVGAGLGVGLYPLGVVNIVDAKDIMLDSVPNLEGCDLPADATEAVDLQQGTVDSSSSVQTEPPESVSWQPVSDPDSNTSVFTPDGQILPAPGSEVCYDSEAGQTDVGADGLTQSQVQIDGQAPDSSGAPGTQPQQSDYLFSAESDLNQDVCDPGQVGAVVDGGHAGGR